MIRYLTEMKRIAIIIGQFHKDLATVMLSEARKQAKASGLEISKEVWVPGSMEKPLALKLVLQKKDIDAAVVLGIIERGETKHGLVMGMSVISAIIQLQLTYNKPVGIGILGPEILPVQIKKRLKPYARDAVLATNEMLTLISSS